MRRLKEKPPVLAKAADLLARQNQSSGKLKEALKRRGYETEEIETAIDKLEKAKYLNDEETCARMFEYFYEEEKLSLRQIYVKLQNRKFPRELIDECIPEDTREREINTAVKALRKKFRTAATNEKMQQFLYSRGFGGSTRYSAIEIFRDENELEEENTDE